MTAPAPRPRAFVCALILAALPLAGCAEGADAGWQVVNPATEDGLRNVLFLLGGLKLTLWLSVVALLAGIALGLICAALLRSHYRWIRITVRLYVELIRTVPLFVLLLWVYYAVPILVRSLPDSGWTSALMALSDLSPFAAATLALSANAGAFLTEIFRAGIESIPRGQVEAARSLGMSDRATFRRIVLPQALRRMLPPTVNQFIMTVKDSSLAAAIGLAELTRRATELQTQTYRPLELYSFLALEYLVVLVILSRLSRYIERRVISE